MKITNRKNLPQIIVDAVQNDPYDAGDSDFTASELIKPAYQANLQRLHRDEIVDDVADRLWSLYGHAVHYVIEQAAGKDDEAETRYYDTINGYRVSAQIDHRYIIDGSLTDWKLTSAYKIKKALEGDFDDWEQQLNIQAYLLRQNGMDVPSLHIGALCRDWSPYKHKTEPGYPDQIEYIEIPLWPADEQLSFIESRIDAHLEAKPCSQQERWQNDPTYALMKRGGSRALKVENTRHKIEEYASHKQLGSWGQNKSFDVVFTMTSDDHYIEAREDKNRRCEGYCNVTQWCDYYQSHYMKAEDLPFKDSK